MNHYSSHIVNGILTDSYLFTRMLQTKKSLCHMNVIPPYGRPALIPLVTSMDYSHNSVKNSHQPLI